MRAVVAESGNQAVKQTATALGLPVWTPAIGRRRTVQLAGLPQAARGSIPAPGPDDAALFMYTSGTTGRPKGVPLSHANVLRSALNVASHYALTPADRSLVVMPLFHGHGLIGATLSTLASGGARDRAAAFFRFRVLAVFPGASRHLVFGGTDDPSGAAGAGGQRRRAHQRDARSSAPVRRRWPRLFWRTSRIALARRSWKRTG